MDSGQQAITIFNAGSGTMWWGDTTVAINSGNALFVNSRVEWLGVQDEFRIFAVAESVQTLVTITQYEV